MTAAEVCGSVLPADVDVMGKERVCALEPHGVEAEHEVVDGGLRIKWRPSDQPAPPTADFDEADELPPAEAWRGRPWPKEPKSWGMDPVVEDEWRRDPDAWPVRRTG